MSKAADLALLAGGADTSTDTTNTGDVALDFSQFQNFIFGKLMYPVMARRHLGPMP